MEKSIILLKSNGESIVLEQPITLKKMQESVGGYVEHVRVLDRIEDGKFIYTSMYVHETGLIDGLPRNEVATKIYQRNIREQYPDSENPFREADKDFKEKALNGGMHFIDAIPNEAYKDDPFLCGDIVFFKGYTCDEVDDLFQ